MKKVGVYVRPKDYVVDKTRGQGTTGRLKKEKRGEA